MTVHFNRLTPVEAECLALIAEECAEVVQVIGKILRHGLTSTHPSGGPSNLALLHQEIGDLTAALKIGADNALLHDDLIALARAGKLQRVGQYLHHAKVMP